MTTPPLIALLEGRNARVRRVPKIRPKEIVLHMQVADVMRRFIKPGWQWTHFPAGELRNPRVAQKLKAMGLAKGWPDFLMLSPAGGKLHALELKRLGEDLTEDQETFRTWCVENGAPHAVARTVDEALAVFETWGCLRIKLTAGGKIGGAA